MPVFLECQRCTACCRWPGQVRLTDEEIRRLAEFKGMTEFDFIQKFTRLSIERRGLVLENKPNQADPASGVEILNILHPTNANHNGGKLQFGTDGYLYFGTGDGGGSNDVPNNAQNGNSLLGKMLRIDVNDFAERHDFATRFFR